MSNQVTMDQNLAERLDLLHDTNQISDVIYSKVPLLLKRVEDEFGIKLDEENGGAFITHLCIALQRIEKGESIQETPEGLQFLAEKYPDLYSFAKTLLEIDEEGEILYITLYLCTLTGK